MLFFFLNQRNGSSICKVKLNLSFCALAPQCPPCCMCTFIKPMLQNVLILLVFIHHLLVRRKRL